MAFITFKYNKNLIYAFIYWPIEIITRIFMHFEWANFFEMVNKDNINEYIYLILLNISDLLAGFLVLYIKHSLKKKKIVAENADVESGIEEIEIIAGRTMTLHKTQYFKFKMTLICFMDFLNRSAYFIFYQTNPEVRYKDISHKFSGDITIHLDIMARYFFSFLILKNKVFKHHKFAIGIILAGLIVLIPTDIILKDVEEVFQKYMKIYILIFIIRGILFPLQDTLTKIIYKEDYVMPDLFMFLRGFGEFMIILVVTPFFYFFVWKKDNVFDTLELNIKSIIFMCILYTLFSFIKAYLLLNVIYYFSSQSVSFLIISESIAGSIYEIINLFIKDKSEMSIKDIFKLVIEIIVVLITTFGTLVYDEIIVIKKCGMDRYVASEIALRANSEIDSLGISFSEDEEEEKEEDNINENEPTVIYD